MDLLAGPKALLSSAIAEALAEYFVIGVDHMECNLFNDSKFVLSDARLKPQYRSIAENTYGKATNICITGFVRQVSLTWSWDWFASGSNSWIKNPVLQIEGCKFKIFLTQGDRPDHEGFGNHSSPGSDTNNAEESKVDEQMSQNGTFEDGIPAFVAKQIQLVVETLTLKIVDFEVTVQMPSSTTVDVAPTISVLENQQEDGNIEIVRLEAAPSTFKSKTFTTPNNNGNDHNATSLSVRGEEFKVTSCGKSWVNKEEILNQKISLSLIFINVTETFHDTIDSTSDSTPRDRIVCKTYPLQEPFSYTLEMTRTLGMGFQNFERGLIVKGGQNSQFGGDAEAASTKKKHDGGLAFRLCRPQIETIGQLSALILTPREKTSSNEMPRDVSKGDDVANTLVGVASKFDICFDAVTVEMMGKSFVATGISVYWAGDEINVSAKINTLSFFEVPTGTQKRGTSVAFSDIVASVQPCIDVTVGSVNKIYVPEVVDLKTPMKNVQASLVGETWTFNIETFDGYLLENDISPMEEFRNRARFMIPFPIYIKLNQLLFLNKNGKDIELAFAGVEILMNPRVDASSTELAFTVKRMESKLASANGINTCMVIPTTEQDTIRDFALSLNDLSVTAGYSIQDWIKTFRIGGRLSKRRSRFGKNNNGKINHMKLPYASVAPLKTKIEYNAMGVVSMKETAFLIKEFQGKESTTAKKLLDYYIAQYLARTPDFLDNAELLGINIKEAGAFSVATTLGLASHINPIVGVAAVVGVDAVRGSIAAGKRSRRAKEGEAAKVGDFFRGIGYSAVEATQKGKLRRGSKDGQGNAIDWMVGATLNTGDYIGKNKDSLGSAGGAGAGILLGTMLGGPVGAVIGGVVGGVTSGTAIRRIDKRIKKAIRKRTSKKEEKE